MPRKKFVINNVEAMREAAIAQKKINEWVTEFNSTEKGNKLKESIRKKYGFDSREFGTITAFFHGYDDKDKFFKDLETEMTNMNNDFFKTMDKFLDAYETYDFGSLKSDTLEDCKKTALIAHLIQIPGNIINHSKEYKEYRLNSIEKQKQCDELTMSATSFLYDVCDNIFRKTGINLNLLGSNGPELEEESDVEKETKEITCDPTLTQDYNNGKSDSYHMTAPDFFYYYDILHEKPKSLSKDIRNKYGELKNSRNCLTNDVIGFRFNNADSFPIRNNPRMDDREFNYFIDGKCINQLLTQKENESRLDFSLRMEIYIAKAIKEGKAIDIAKTYVKDGKANTEIIPLKIDFSPEITKKIIKERQEAKVVKEHNWFRRTFLDWGFLKIKRDPNIMENIEKENDANKQKRHEEILKYRNGEFLTEANKKRAELKIEQLQPGNLILSKYELEHQKENNIQKDDRIQLDIANEEFISKQEEQKVNNNKQKNVELENNLEVNNKEIQS